MQDPFPGMMDRLQAAVLAGPGNTSPDLRCACAANTEVPAPLAAYVDKVARHAYKVTDEEVQALLQAGYSEDQLFEITVSTALGAGLARLEAGLKALQGEL